MGSQYPGWGRGCLASVDLCTGSSSYIISSLVITGINMEQLLGEYSYITFETLRTSYSINRMFVNLFSSLCTLLVAAVCVGLVTGDQWPGSGGFYDICVEIIDDVNGNSIPFRELSSNQLTERERLSRSQLCNRLTNQHNTHNSGFIAASVSQAACSNALLSPALYQTADWNQWAGKHCGTWYSSDGSTFPDHANWNNAGIQSGFHHQDVNFFGRSCQTCHDGWNESGGGVSYHCCGRRDSYSYIVVY